MDESQKLSRTIWVGIGLIIVLIAVAFVLSRVQPPHRNSGPDFISQVADFTLTNQNDRVTTLADLRGHIWVADIIFTRCAGPCPRMTQQMKSLQTALAGDDNVRFVTLTTDPEFDTPEVLRRYGARFGADTNNWLFLTGKKSEIANLAGESLKLAGVEKEESQRETPEDLFIHSTYFVVVDKQARLREVFETGGPGIEWTNVQPEIVSTIRRLESER